MLEENRSIVKSYYKIDYNAAFVMILSDGRGMIIPPVLGEEDGLLFDNLEEMQQMIDSRTYPVKGTGTFWERERENLLNMPYAIEVYCERLTKKLAFKVEVNNNADYLAELSSVMSRKIKGKGFNQDFHLMTSLFLSELVRVRVNAIWKLFIVYALNRSYKPELVKGEMFVDSVGFIIGELDMVKHRPLHMPLDIESVLQETIDRFMPMSSENQRYLDL